MPDNLDLQDFADRLRAALLQLYAQRFPNTIASPSRAAEMTVTVVMAQLQAALQDENEAGR